MKVTRQSDGTVILELSEDQAKKLLYVAQDTRDIYLDVLEDTTEDPEVSGHASLVYDMLATLQKELEDSGLVD